MKKKLLAALLILALALSLAACGGGGGDPAPSQTTPDSSAAAPSTQTPDNSDSTPAELSGTLEIWSSGEELGRFVEGFNTIYPDVTVKKLYQ